jgi:hypothetical protein
MTDAHAQSPKFDCAAARPSKSLRPAYGRGPNPLICEGFYDRNVSQPFIEVVSALLQPAASFRNLDAARFYLKPRIIPRRPMNLLVQPLPVATLYRVDARMENGQVKWTPAQMLELTHLRLSELGFLAIAEPRRGGELVVVPLQVETAPPGPASTAFITIRVSTEISQLKWRVYPTFGAQAPDLAWQDALARPLYRWASYPLQVPLPADGSSITLEVNAFDKKKEPLRSLQLVIAGGDYEHP